MTLHLFPEMNRSAIFSKCGQFRYQLTRVWDPSKPVLPWGLSNPSTAGYTSDDATIRKVIGFTQRLCGGKYGGAVVWNLYAYISTDPKGLRDAGWPVGPRNDEFILDACSAAGRGGLVIVGWGAHLSTTERPNRVLAMLRAKRLRPMALGLSRDGHPKHPLYLPYTSQPVELPFHLEG